MRCDTEADLLKINALANKGELFAAVDAAVMALQQFDQPSVELRHLTVLLMARAGSLNEAIRHFYNLGLDNDTGVEARTLGARLLKDIAFSTRPEKQHEALESAGAAYLQIYQDTKDSYPGINAATLAALAGDFSTAKSLAAKILKTLALSPDQHSYWHYATVAEAHILCGDDDAALKAITLAAASEATNLTNRASTLAQLRRLLTAQDRPHDILKPLTPKITLHYTGHMIAAQGDSGRILAEHENELSLRISRAIDAIDPGAAFGALASGSDILIAEHLIKRNIDLHVILPFAIDEFVDVSVRPAGAQWIKRFHACISQAKTLGFLTEQPYLNDDLLFGIAAKLAMGRAILHAGHISGEARQLAIWDRRKTSTPAGTSADVVNWQERGNDTHIVDVADLGNLPKKSSTTGPSSFPNGTRVEAAMLFGDVKGFSKLNDAELPLFVEHILGTIKNHLGKKKKCPRLVNTWGDGLFAVWDTPVHAARQALLIQDAIAEFSSGKTKLPMEFSMRISLHHGVAHRLMDPILNQENYFGEAVARAARIEPITPPGGIYTTEQFAAMLMLENHSPVVAEYVGKIAAAKDFGSFPLYRLRWKLAH